MGIGPPPSESAADRAAETTDAQRQRICVLNEKSLHAALKEWYASPGTRVEVLLDGYIVDLLQDGRLVEIQTRNFAALKQKVFALAQRHPVRLIYPVAQEKWIVKLASDGTETVSRRKSPKRGRVEEVFGELVSFPELLSKGNFSLEVLLIQEEEIRRFDGARRWRRGGWVTHERRLLGVTACKVFETPADAAALVPAPLAEPFTTSELAAAIGIRRNLAQKMAYCLRKMGAIREEGRRRGGILYRRVGNAA